MIIVMKVRHMACFQIALTLNAARPPAWSSKQPGTKMIKSQSNEGYSIKRVLIVY